MTSWASPPVRSGYCTENGAEEEPGWAMVKRPRTDDHYFVASDTQLYFFSVCDHEGGSTSRSRCWSTQSYRV